MAGRPKHAEVTTVLGARSADLPPKELGTTTNSCPQLPDIAAQRRGNDQRAEVSAVVDAPQCDENLLINDLRPLDRGSRTAFAAACAERLWPLVERYAATVALPWNEVRILRGALDSTWAAAIGEHVNTGMEEVIDSVENLAPFEGEGWVLESGYAQNGIAAIAYALRSWVSDDPQQAVWAARQVYEAADYAVERGPSLSAPHLWERGSELLGHPLEVIAIQAILADLKNAELNGPKVMREEIVSVANDFSRLFP